MHHAPFLLDCQYRLYSLSVLSFFICHYQGLPLPCTTNVISCQYLTLDRVGIEPTTFQSADQASNHYTVDTTGYTLLLCKAETCIARVLGLRTKYRVEADPCSGLQLPSRFSKGGAQGRDWTWDLVVMEPKRYSMSHRAMSESVWLELLYYLVIGDRRLLMVYLRHKK